MINMGMVRSEGGTIEIRATPWIEEGFDSDTGESIETVHQGGLFNAEVFHAAKGTTRVILGGGDIPDNLEASVFGSARFRVGDLSSRRALQKRWRLRPLSRGGPSD